MGYIKQLSEELIKKIAAGEVIERPASVVKELVENSIDASATKIEIEIERAGRYIKVSDNGMGIDPDDIDLLFKRHATSKIKRFDDLWNIRTLGFRGEALSSISSVSKITCKSKHINQEYGFEIKILEGKINKKSSAVHIGTVFEVDELFYNVPARQKFLKSETTEIGHIFEIINSLALSYPKISFTLLNNKNILLKTSASGNLKDTIVELLGADLKDKLISLTAQNEFLELNACISALEVFRSDKKSIFVFVNDRPVKCPIVSKAIFSAYEGLLPSSKYPVVILNLNFKPKFVDVNVHPTKKEVRYTQPNDVYNLVLHTIQNAVSDHYKKEYKEKSIYAIPEIKKSESLEVKTSRPQDIKTLGVQYTEAAFDFYTPVKDCAAKGEIEEQQIFSVNNLKCKIIYSNKPIANMTKISNKTIFEVGMIFDNDMQIVFSGEITGEQDFQKAFFNSLANLSNEIYRTQLGKAPSIQKKIVNSDLEEENNKETKRKKPPEKTLYEIWERDNWICVYCKKQLLDPKLVKDSMSDAKDAFITYINEEGKEITTHLLREHIASYDHYLPVSKLPQFNFDSENLFACCVKCNQKKLNSISLETWKPDRQNSWGKPLKVAGLTFDKPTKKESKFIQIP